MWDRTDIENEHRSRPGSSGRIITWATFAGGADNPMGLQHYEMQVLQALHAMQSADRLEWSFTQRTVGSVRGESAADVRLPMGILAKASSAGARTAGRWAYRGAHFVHRFDLRLPPPIVPEVVTVHDLPPLRFEDEGQISKWSIRTAREARLIICPSNFAAAEVTELLGVSDVVVVPNGVSAAYQEATHHTPAELSLLGIGGSFLLHVGGATERKNLRGLAAAWQEASHRLPEISLVLVGPPDPRRDIAFSGCPRVIKLGYRSSDQVARLMASALLVVVPSVYEGFGLPAVEAMASGSPVVAARAGALPEVCGNAAMLVDPQPGPLAEVLVQVARDEDLRAHLTELGRHHAARFTWSQTARGHVDAYERAFG